MIDALKALGRKLLPYALAALGGLASGVFLGRCGPSPAEITEKTSTDATTHVERTEDVKASERIESEKKVAKHVTTKARTVTEKKPDGSTTTTRTVVRDEHTGENTTEKRDTDTVRKDTLKGDESVHKDTLKVTTFKRDWRVSALVGAELVNPITHAGSPIGSVAYGLHAERRIIGPIWGGVWGLGVGPARIWYAGFSLGVEF